MRVDAMLTRFRLIVCCQYASEQGGIGAVELASAASAFYPQGLMAYGRDS
jgi:hypothetical protein